MNHTYQPSGKISPVFWPAAAAVSVATAAAALLCVFGIQASHATLLDMMIYFAVTGFVAKCGTLLCVKGGRVRNPAFAKAAGIALAVWYWLLLIAFSTPVKAVLTAEGSAWIWKWDGAWKEALVQFVRDFSGGAGAGGSVGTEGVLWTKSAVWLSRLKMFWEPVLSLKGTGAVVTGKRGNTLFTLPGMACVALLAVLFLAAVWQLGFAFWRQGRAPFCEASGKWMRETVVNLRCREEETFLSRLLLGDTTVLADLEPLGSEDADCYIKASVFAADRSAAFYVSVSKMKKAEKQKAEKKRTPRSAERADVKSQRRKKPAFEEEMVAEYLVLDRGTGLALLSRGMAETAKKRAWVR